MPAKQGNGLVSQVARTVKSDVAQLIQGILKMPSRYQVPDLMVKGAKGNVMRKVCHLYSTRSIGSWLVGRIHTGDSRD